MNLKNYLIKHSKMIAFFILKKSIPLGVLNKDIRYMNQTKPKFEFFHFYLIKYCSSIKEGYGFQK